MDCDPPVKTRSQVSYAYYGIIYYSSETVFKTLDLGLANLLVLTVTSLSTSLKVDELSQEAMETLSSRLSSETLDSV